MGGGVEEVFAQIDELLIAHLLSQEIDRHGGDKLLVADGGTVLQDDGAVVSIDLDDISLITETGLLLGQSVCDGGPDTTSASVGREAESGVRTPVTGGLLQDDVRGDGLHVRCGNTLTKPGALHLEAGSLSILIRKSQRWRQ